VSFNGCVTVNMIVTHPYVMMQNTVL